MAVTVEGIGFEVIEGRAFFSLTLGERPDLLVVIPAGVGPKTPLARVGDAITVGMVEEEDALVRAATVDIPAVGARKSTAHGAGEQGRGAARRAHADPKVTV